MNGYNKEIIIYYYLFSINYNFILRGGREMLKKLKNVLFSNFSAKFFIIAFSVIFPASAYAGTALNTPCGSGSFAGTSYLSTPCSSTYNCCIAPSEPVVKKVKPVVKKQVKKIAAAKPAVVKKRVSTYNISASFNDLRFPFNSAVLTAKDKAILRRDARYLNNNRSVVVMIKGYCDSRGSQSYNLALSRRRVIAAKNFLENLGISGSRLKTGAYGKLNPLCSAHTASCYALNRRDHFVVLSR